jgi:hypothetical protein
MLDGIMSALIAASTFQSPSIAQVTPYQQCLNNAAARRIETIQKGGNRDAANKQWLLDVEACGRNAEALQKVAQQDSGTSSIRCDENGCVEVTCDANDVCTEKKVSSVQPAPGCSWNGPVISCSDLVAKRLDDPCDADKNPSPVGPLCHRGSGRIDPIDPSGKDFDPVPDPNPAPYPPTNGGTGTRMI